MNLRLLKITFRSVAAFLIIVAALIFMKGGLAFTREEQRSSDTYVISHTVIFSHSAIFPAIAGVLLFACSFAIPIKKP
jgi:hypothetical protein